MKLKEVLDLRFNFNQRIVIISSYNGKKHSEFHDYKYLKGKKLEKINQFLEYDVVGITSCIRANSNNLTNTLAYSYLEISISDYDFWHKEKKSNIEIKYKES